MPDLALLRFTARRTAPDTAVRLVGEDFDGAYDDVPARAIAAA